MTPDRSSALLPLQQVADRLATLRSAPADAAGHGAAVLDVIAAVEWTLRRLLRDAPVAPLQLRLSALAPDELRSDEVLGELRQHDLITMEAAAGVHHLFQIRDRLTAGRSALPADAGQAAQVADLLEAELSRPTLVPPSVQETRPEGETRLDGEVRDVPPPRGRLGERRTLTVAGAAATLILVLLLLSRWLGGAGGSAEMEQGIALFRSGAYADAAHHFYRYAQRNPDEATPHLYLARIHRRLGRPELAGPALQEAMRLAPEDAAVHRELGFLLIDTGRFDVAVERFRAAVSMDSESPEGWLGLVLALRRDGRAAEAERVLARAPQQVRERFGRQDSPTDLP